ncbi:MAG: ABC transporter ATP-binding protein [Myxococcota bacterium]
MQELCLEALEVRSDDDRPVLSGSARFGGVTAVLGPSGAGKSSLAWALVDLLPPGLRRVSGRLRLNDMSLWADRPGPIGIVPQDPILALDGRKTPRQHMVIASRAAGVASSPAACQRRFRRWRFPDSRLDALPSGLSGGELRRAVLALALVRSPPVLILDEPTVGLDAEVAGALERELFQPLASEGHLLILLTHDLFLARRLATRVVVVDQGRIIEENEAKGFWTRPSSEGGRALVGAHRGLEDEEGAHHGSSRGGGGAQPQHQAAPGATGQVE